MIHILISPIRSVIHEIPDSDAWYILCFSARRELEPSPNARAFYFLDTTEETLKVAQGESDAEIWNSPEYHPNPLVYRTCRETFFDPGI